MLPRSPDTGNFAGGRVNDGNGTGGSASQDTECYTPYEQCTSAPTGDTTETPSIPNAQFCSAANASNNDLYNALTGTWATQISGSSMPATGSLGISYRATRIS